MDRYTYLTVRLLAASYEEMRQIVDGLSIEERSELNSVLMGMSATAGMVAHYLDWRGAAGCGDHSHEQALQEAQKRKVELRKALNYSYP